jgi:hypothetical protein
MDAQFFNYFLPTIRRKMPYRLRKVPKKDLYWVVGPDGKHHSKEGLPKERAQAQMRALYASENEKLKGGQETNPFDPAFAQQEVEKSRAALQTGIAQLTPEQVEANLGYIKSELAPTKFTTREAPTQAEYEKYANAYKKRGQAPPMTFEQWLAFQSQRELGRQKDYTGVSQAKRVLLSDLGSVVAQREEEAFLAAQEEARDPTVVCPYGKDNKRQNIRELVKQSECARRQDQFFYNENPTLYNANKYFFNPVVSGLTKIADAAVEYGSQFLPGVGQVAAEVYKNFAPPGSQYYGQNLLVGQGHFHRVSVRGGATHRKNVLKRLGLEDKSYSLKELSKASSVPMKILREVYKRGIGAFKTQPSSVRLKGSFVKNVDAPMSKKLSKEQWAYARVYSFLDGNPKHDEDLRANKDLKGGSWWMSAFNKAKELAKGVVQRVVDVSKGVRKDNYPPRVRKLIGEIGESPIVEIKVRRDPIKGMLNTVLNFVTLGKWNVMREKLPFDKIFHLGLELTIRLSNENEMTSRYVLEKNEVINIGPAKAVTKDTEFWPVGMKGSTTLNALLEGGQRVLGSNFYVYDAFTNNCQDFIAAVLQGSGLATPALTAVVKQPLDNALQTELPSYTGKVARFATDAAALANVAFEGRGAGARFQAQLEKAGVKPRDYLRLAQRAAQRFGYNPKKIDWSDKAGKKLMIQTPGGLKVHFGAVGHGDWLLYKLKGESEYADKKRRAYLARATRIKGDWHSDKYSPNNLAINVLWFPKGR